MKLLLSQIRCDGGTQPRASINGEVATEYGAEMVSGRSFPSILCFYDGADYWLADGYHRFGGAVVAGLQEIEADITQGTLEDAQWYSFSANQAHGLRRSNEDKQRAVKAAIMHAKSAGLSDHQIAKHVGVAVSTVGDWRKKLESTVGNLQRDGADGRATNTGKIGRKPKAEPLVVAAPEYIEPRPIYGAATSPQFLHQVPPVNNPPCGPEIESAAVAQSAADSEESMDDAAEYRRFVENAWKVLECPLLVADLRRMVARDKKSAAISENLRDARDLLADVCADGVNNG
jgi:transposase-like protein